MTRHPRRRRIEGGGLVFSVLEEASSWTTVAVSDDDAGAAIGRCSVLDDAGSCCCLPVLSLLMFEYLLHIFCTVMSARANIQAAQYTNVAAAQLFRLAQLQLLQQLSQTPSPFCPKRQTKPSRAVPPRYPLRRPIPAAASRSSNVNRVRMPS